MIPLTSLAILLAFACALLVKYEVTFVVMIALSVLLQQFVLIPEKIKLFEALSLFAMILFFVKRPFRISSRIREFPSKASFVLILLSLLMSTYVAVDKHYPTVVIFFVVNMVNVFIFWGVLKNDVFRFSSVYVRTIILLGGAVVLCAIVETVMGENPYIQFVNSEGLYVNNTVVTEMRYGFKRSQSLFGMHTTSAGVSLIISCIIMDVYLNAKVLKGRIAAPLTSVLLIVVVFLSGARSAMVGAVIAITMFLYIFFRKKWLILAAPLIFVIALSFDYYWEDVVGSIIDSRSVDGSNADMRGIQYEIALSYLKESLWFGNGISYTWTSALPANEQLYGAESMWIPIMIDFGLLGIASYAAYFLSIFFYLHGKRLMMLAPFVIGILVFNTMSSIPDVSILWLLVYVLIMVESRAISSDAFGGAPNSLSR